MRIALLPICVFAMTACANAPAPVAGVQFLPDQQGLAVVPGGLRVDFGRAPSGVVAALDRELGPGRALSVAGCPTGVAQQRAWGDLVLTFTGEEFVGWRSGATHAGTVCASA